MQVDLVAGHVDLGVHQAAQPGRDRRHVAFEEARVADHDDVGREPRPVLLEPAVEVDRARFLLALEQVLHVDRQGAAGGQQSGGRHHVGVDLALVVGRATGQQALALDHGLERRRRPEVQRIDRLDVVVAVDQHGRCPGGVQPVGVDDGMTVGFADLGMLDAGRRQGVDQPAGSRGGNRRRDRAAPRCSGSGGSRSRTRSGRPASRPGGLPGRRRDRASTSPHETSGPSPARSFG